MVYQSPYDKDFIESQTIEISQDGLRSILRQIENELINSEIYRRTMAGLESILGDASITGQTLVKAVGREAIRLTFQQFIRQYHIVPVTSEKVNQTIEEKLDCPPMVEDNPAQKESVPDTNPVEEDTSSVETNKPSNLIRKLFQDTKLANKLSETEPEEGKLIQERKLLLRQIGQELQQARLSQSLSVKQLHSQTLVPAHHIEALETGNIDLLPEDVYVRGFIRRIGNALGLNGVALAASLPEAELFKKVTPSWYQETSRPGFQLSSIPLNSVHLYLGYTALIAGAIGGLSWMSNQSVSEVSVDQEPDTPSQSSFSQKAEHQETITKPGLTSIAPPEASLPF
ncbi:helix-turn-helix domain-containing protein [Lyngbya aestuarii]|uniref:helix-turn-helix domain-containing protein n=1 Tax=Lyngbya aestuarii TaxID=118322 RepID=UPI00403D8E7A